MRDYEEYHELPPRWGWSLIVLLCLALLGWGLLIYGLVRDRQRQWDYGALPETPASSIYTTTKPPAGAPPARQMEPLPGARPLPGQEVKP